ncbi:class I SAM-dependent methyltransferase [Streptomyces decoyicus]|uniref:class I SAM-dependent methyltransferase n=1 Tax=Streptomyces decoyicus TaxID=249567 RepID=UPI0038656E53|nr:class I SAM-dependent methyltransferase [Streptomyces decoyicus]
MDKRLELHYEKLSEIYNDLWETRPDYPDWMAEEIRDRLRVTEGQRIADIGVGTGLFLRRLLPYATPQNPVVSIDPSAALLELLPQDPRLHAVQATAEEVVAGEVSLPYETFDAIVIKEAVHHFTDLENTLAGLATRLAPGGRFLIVALPPRIDYPLFEAALDRFASEQPEPEKIAASLELGGLKTTIGYKEFPLSVDRDKWLRLVGDRWMSVLSNFSENELVQGLKEIEQRYTRPQLEFNDRFAFILGERPAA